VVATLRASSQDNVDKIKSLLLVAAEMYEKDRETIAWHCLQDAKDPLKFTIVERYQNGTTALKEHTSNPMFKRF
ncbi:hypothetical protein BT69DRAFT_1191673, partial [Atractiella rhizophila]